MHLPPLHFQPKDTMRVRSHSEAVVHPFIYQPDDAKFRQKVVPGDTLLFRVELLSPVRHGISSMKGYMFVGDQVVSEATFTAQIVKNK